MPSEELSTRPAGEAVAKASLGLRPLLVLRAVLLLFVLSIALSMGLNAVVGALSDGTPHEGLRSLMQILALNSAMLLAGWLTIRSVGLRFRTSLSFRPLGRSGLVGSILLGLGTLLFNASLTAHLFHWLDPAFIEVWKEIFAGLDSLLTVAGTTVLAGILVPFIEEIFFRGVILQAFLARWGSTWSILAAALLFGIVHMNPLHGLVAFILGIFAGWGVVATGTIWAGIVVHVVNNVVGLRIPVETLLPTWVAVPGVACLVAGCVILTRNRHRATNTRAMAAPDREIDRGPRDGNA